MAITSEQTLRHAPLSLSKRPLNMGHKIPYVDVISDAILQSPDRRLTAKEIFEHVSAKYGPTKKTETLKNTIRHTLSRYNVFRKVQRGRQKKPNWWTVDEKILYAVGQAEHDLQQQQPVQQQQNQASTPSLDNHHSIIAQPGLMYGGGAGPAATPLNGYPSHSHPQSSVFFANSHTLTQPSTTTDYSSHYHRGQPDTNGMHQQLTASYPHPPPEDNVRHRGGHYMLSVEDLAANGQRSWICPARQMPMGFK